MNKDSTVDTNKFEICTLLKEIYPSAEIEEKYEPPVLPPAENPQQTVPVVLSAPATPNKTGTERNRLSLTSE